MTFTFESTVDLPREHVFAFHERPGNLALLMRRWRAFRMIAHDGLVRVGNVMRVQERIGILCLSMTFEHFLYEPPHRFGERLLCGPFRKFEHIHEFEPVGSGTVVRDLLDIRLPWYPGGELSMRLLGGARFRRMLAYRHTELLRLAREGVVEKAAMSGPHGGG